MSHNFKKILIVGESGRGKTTLANRLSEKLTIAHHSTDDFFWEVKYTKPRDREFVMKMANEQYSKDQWIVEGTSQWLIEPGLDDADLILFLEFKTIFHQWFSIIKRQITKRRHESLRSMLFLLKHVFYKRYSFGYKKGAVTNKELLRLYKEKVISLDSFEKINQFVSNL